MTIMRKLIICVAMFLAILIVILYFLSHDENISKRIATNSEFARASVSELTERLLTLEKVTCIPDNEFQECLNLNVDNLIVTPPGKFSIRPFNLNRNQTLIISQDTILELSDDAKMPRWGGYVLGMFGQIDAPIQDIVLVLEGVIDGNKKEHPYSESGNECIRIDYGRRIFISGRGRVQNCSGDGIDIDASSLIYLHGIAAYLNSGSGFHIGSGRPIRSSKDIIGIALDAKENGFVVERAGIDSSWPNSNSVIYLLSKSEGNYRNWELSAAGSYALLNLSVNQRRSDLNFGATFTLINNKITRSFSENIVYYFNLIRRDIARLRGRDQPDFLKALPYIRDEE